MLNVNWNLSLFGFGEWFSINGYRFLVNKRMSDDKWYFVAFGVKSTSVYDDVETAKSECLKEVARMRRSIDKIEIVK